MNFSQESNVQISLPQFSEITSRSNEVPASRFSSSENGSSAQVQSSQSAIYTTATSSTQTKQLLVNSPNKYPSTVLTWPDPNTLMQLCEKQGLQAINIPNYTQNNATAILSVQPNSLPVRIIPNVCVPSQLDISSNKQESENRNSSEQGNPDNTNMTESQQAQLQSIAMAEYLQKLQATTLPLTLQQLIKLQSDQMKKEKPEEEPKTEQVQNNILNIPSVPAFRNTQMHNGNHFMNTDHMMIAINPSDLNVHMEQPPDEESNAQQQQQQQVPKVEQQIQTESPKPEKKMKFRAKTGEIKITVALDGSTLFCCPECNLAFGEKADVDQHILGHIQERKYQCKQCGAMLKRKEHLDQHMRGHSDERPFKCPVCQKAFKRNEHLTRHYVIHSGDKNFSCTVCQKAFSRKDHLNKHAQTHLGIKRTKSRKDIIFVDSRDSLEKLSDTVNAPKQEVSFVLKDGNFIKQDSSLIQQLQSLQKDSTLIHTFSAFKEQAMRDGLMLQQQAVNMNEILPQNTRYLMPS